MRARRASPMGMGATSHDDKTGARADQNNNAEPDYAMAIGKSNGAARQTSRTNPTRTTRATRAATIKAMATGATAIWARIYISTSCLDHIILQSINQSVNPSNKSKNQSINQTRNQSTNQSIIQQSTIISHQSSTINHTSGSPLASSQASSPS